MIWALLFALILAGTGSDLGDYTRVANASYKEGKQIVHDIIPEKERSDIVLDLLKQLRKEGKQAEKEINKHYVRLDRMEKKYDYSRSDVEDELRELALKRREFQDDITVIWEEVKLQFSDDEWEDLRTKTEELVSEKQTEKLAE
jgi:hypothetical protein